MNRKRDLTSENTGAKTFKNPRNGDTTFMPIRVVKMMFDAIVPLCSSETFVKF